MHVPAALDTLTVLLAGVLFAEHCCCQGPCAQSSSTSMCGFSTIYFNTREDLDVFIHPTSISAHLPCARRVLSAGGMVRTSRLHSASGMSFEWQLPTVTHSGDLRLICPLSHVAVQSIFNLHPIYLQLDEQTGESSLSTPGHRSQGLRTPISPGGAQHLFSQGVGTH